MIHHPTAVQQRLERAIEQAGSQKKWAEENGFSCQFVCDVLKGRRDISDKFAAALGFRKVILWQEVTDDRTTMLVATYGDGTEVPAKTEEPIEFEADVRCDHDGMRPVIHADCVPISAGRYHFVASRIAAHVGPRAAEGPQLQPSYRHDWNRAVNRSDKEKK